MRTTDEKLDAVLASLASLTDALKTKSTDKPGSSHGATSTGLASTKKMVPKLVVLARPVRVRSRTRQVHHSTTTMMRI